MARRSNPMQRPTARTFKPEEWGTRSLAEAQAIWDRAFRKSEPPDPRDVFLRESRRPYEAPDPRREYRAAIRAPLRAAKGRHQEERYRELEERYQDRPLEIWTNPRRVSRLSINDTGLDTWFERDRAHVALYQIRNPRTGLYLSERVPLLDWWDDEVQEAIDDGFLDPRRLHQSAFEYAVHIGVVREK